MTFLSLARGEAGARSPLRADERVSGSGAAYWAAPLLAAACWGAWIDIAHRADAPETAVPLALVALAACAPAALRLARGEALLRVPLAVPCLLLIAYLACFPLEAPALARAWIAFAALLTIVHGAGAARRPGMAFFGLVLLALPVMSSLEFYLAHPMRLASAAITTFMLKMNGLAVSMEGVALRFGGETIQFDAPCSGVRMLWTSWFLASAIAYARGFNALAYAASLAAASVLAIFGNAIRAASLFPVETGLLQIAAPFDVHEAIGLAAFAMTALALVALLAFAVKLSRLGLVFSRRGDPCGRPERGPSGPHFLTPAGERARLKARGPRGDHKGRPYTPYAFGLLIAASALAPLAPRKADAIAAQTDFPGWPATFEGRTLIPVPLAPEDSYFTRGFPGRIARFSDGRRHLVVRWVNAPTRRLHPAAQCFKGAGYAIEPRPMRRAADGALMGCFAARKEGRSLRVCEMVRGADGRARSDVSSWHWAAMFAPQGLHWWSYVVVERE